MNTTDQIDHTRHCHWMVSETTGLRNNAWDGQAILRYTGMGQTVPSKSNVAERSRSLGVVWSFVKISPARHLSNLKG